MGTPELGKLFLESLVNSDGCFDHTALRGVRDIRASPGRIQCTMTVDASVRNRYGTLHGGCTATLIDTVGSAALVTVSKRSGVSLNISTTYLAAMPEGEEVEIDARVVRVSALAPTSHVFTFNWDIVCKVTICHRRRSTP